MVLFFLTEKMWSYFIKDELSEWVKRMCALKATLVANSATPSGVRIQFDPNNALCRVRASRGKALKVLFLLSIRGRMV